MVIQQESPPESTGSDDKRLRRNYFKRPTRVVARALLGTRLVRREANGSRVSGIIHEVEAYIGTDDLACHARAGRTRRNRAMWGRAGFAYVYFNYGMHWLLNLVTEEEGFPAAVLVRGLVPTEGLQVIRKRRGGRVDRLTDGPAKICQAFNVSGDEDGCDLCGPQAKLYLERCLSVSTSWIQASPRIGIDNVPEPFKSLPWRFFIDPARIRSLVER